MGKVLRFDDNLAETLKMK